MPDLHPCPFCGQVEPYVSLVETTVNSEGDTWATNGKTRFQVACGKCATHSAICKDEEAAATAWNTRVAHQAVYNLVTALHLYSSMERGVRNALWDALEVLDPEMHTLCGKDEEAAWEMCARRVGVEP